MQARREMDHLSRAQRESLGELFGELASQSAALIRDEVTLAKQELREQLSQLQSALLMVALGVSLAALAALALCAAAIIALAEYVGPWPAALIVGAALAMMAGVIASIGFSRLRRTSLKPRQTLETLEEDRAWLREIT